MKKASKKLLVLGMTILLSFSLALGGCGSTTNVVNDNTKAVDNTPDTLKLGGLFSLTGTVAAIGAADKQGTELAVDEINNAGGLNINGKKVKVEFVSYDIGDDPAKAIEFAQRLVNMDKVKVINGPENHPQVAGALKVTDPAKILTYNGISSSAIFSAGSKYGFNMSDNGPTEMHSLGQILQESAAKLNAAGMNGDRMKKVKKFVLFGRNEPYSINSAAGAKEAAEKFGYSYDSVLFPAGTTDFLPYINKLKELKPDAVMLNTYSLDIMLPPLKDMLQVGGLDWTKGDIVLMGNDVMANPWFIDEAKKQGISMDGAVCFSSVSATQTDKFKSFNDRVKAKYGDGALAMAGFVGNSYDATMTMLKGIEGSGTIVDSDKMVQGVLNNTYVGMNFPMKVLPQKQLEQPEYMLTIKNGKLVDTGITYKSEVYWGKAFEVVPTN